jgi:tetraacyldisaccharide 4'-kinase
MNLFSAAYATLARARRRHYERRPERQRRLRQPVISVGNLSVGGTGKTPAVAHIARLLLGAGERPAILTRGYRRRQPTDGVLVVSDGRHILADLPRAGDEPLMLARALPGVAVLVGADRHLSGLLAERRLGCSVHLLDDGFQHVQLHRDVDIVLVAPEDLHDRVLPAGRLREGREALSRADAIVITGGPADLQAIAQSAGRSVVFHARTSVGSATAGSVFAVAGIARPQRFFDLLAASGWVVASTMTFPDHHWYARADLDRIAAAAHASAAHAVVTTEKDLVRLLPFRPFPVPVVAAPLEFVIEPAAQFHAWLTGHLAAARSAASRGDGRVPAEQPA